MKIINDSDTTTFTDDSGDTLVLLDCPRQRDVEKSNKLQREDAFAQLEDLKAAGVDTSAVMEKATTEDAEAAAEAAKAEKLPLEVRRFRLGALAKSLTVSGQTFGGQEVVNQYDNMDYASSTWVDAQVAIIWATSEPDDAQREDAATSDVVPDVTAVASEK